MIASKCLYTRYLLITKGKGALQWRSLVDSMSFKRPKWTFEREKSALSPKGTQHITQTFLPRMFPLQSVLKSQNTSLKNWVMLRMRRIKVICSSAQLLGGSWKEGPPVSSWCAWWGRSRACIVAGREGHRSNAGLRPIRDLWIGGPEMGQRLMQDGGEGIQGTGDHYRGLCRFGLSVVLVPCLFMTFFCTLTLLLTDSNRHFQRAPLSLSCLGR